MTTSPKLAGKALYFELIANPALSEDEQRSACGWQYQGTKQVIMFPEWQDDTGRVHPAKVLYRVVSAHSPRAQWSDFVATDKPKPLSEVKSRYESESYEEVDLQSLVVLEDYKKEEWDLLPEKARQDSKGLGLKLNLIRQVTSFARTAEGAYQVKLAWTPRDNKPLVVETTDQDLEELHLHYKTPQAVIRRINKVRDSVSTYPKKLY
jgi:hypothetical protein